MKNRMPKITGRAGGLKKQILIALILMVVLIGAAGILAWSSSRHLTSAVSEIEFDLMRSQMEDLKKILFQRNPYLQPDTFYLGKLEAVFYEGRAQEGTSWRRDGNGNLVEMNTAVVAVSNIAINIRKGISYSSSLRSCYWMLEDPLAPYVLINGSAQHKDELIDRDWIETCLGMQEDLVIAWRTIPLSYLNSAEVLTVFRRVTCESVRPGENITGYWVLNYNLQTVMNAMAASVQSSESVYLYSRVRDGYISSGSLEMTPDMEEELISAAQITDVSGVKSGILQERDGGFDYYLAEKICDDVTLITCLRDVSLQGAVGTTNRVIVLILLISFLIIAAIDIAGIIRYQRYNRGLRKMLSAMEAPSADNEKPEALADEGTAERLIERILNNDVDLQELQSMLESQRELKAELDMLYGHVQINSHFLLNTLDSIYWASVSQSGAESRETVMIGDLCVILKYALDSSDLYTSLGQEIECAQMYLEIQQLRKNIRVEAVWNVPEALKQARVSKLILQPVIENCIQHGLPKTGDKSLRIVIGAEKTQDGLLKMTVTDNGVGISAKELRRMNQEMKRQKYLRSRHIGLANVNRRLQVQFGGESGVSLSASDAGGLKVTLAMNFSPYEPNTGT